MFEVEAPEGRLIELINEAGTAGLYTKIVDAAVTIMRSQFATMQILYPDAGSHGKLRIVASHGFNEEALKYWEWVYHYTGSSCGEVLRTRRRVIIPDYRTCEFMQKEPTLPMFINGGILAAQSTPLFSNAGKLVGMISTHWNEPYTPTQHQLEMLDVLARKAADLVERYQEVEAVV